MSSKNKNLSKTSGDIPSGKGYKIGIVVSEWNEKITNALYDGCLETLITYGVDVNDIKTIHVPGTFELPVGAKMLLGEDNYNAIICIGCVIKGETKHDEYISNAVANGLVNLGVLSGKPIIFGVLTPNTSEQAEDRAGGKHGNKGVEAAVTALKMADIKRSLKGFKVKIGF
ncbi:6,7-dimethyl-8-ribityllumazine synthase [Portibacter lacus]|uniref:6,7-dimethyl-8-ribityllumazine synthase n=1 Tax=Portibacter lacus TaxID=1099794 RepID=A0AA37SN43_9BACT|nr:6,7-dimethyl-8-ribityllumazine synthase [Portibacter lacus]GLR16444.1 6,7-dimethyl-8-ribityllumazine synthase [Portibacter lacus]